ncbi:type II secretion system F family protein [Actinoplanes sp. GCM10030250]|uniref:type II secretion system F family protein n=1 Tax=Actinoplanes sp. GCM10030250 TaxID=3273376 RepID=UPI00361E2944
MSWLAAGALLGGVVVIVWPRGGVRDRLPGRRVRGRMVVDLSGIRLPRSPKRVALGSAGLVAAPALLAGGPVAGVVAGVYAGLAASEWARRAARKRVVAGRVAAFDGLCSLVADLRAGMPPAAVAGSEVVAGSAFASGSGVVRGDERISALVGAVWRLAERTGAPAADLLDRIETDARVADRAAKAAAAQAAGAQATAFLLAALPVGGIGLGYSIGADPLHVLLRTPLGAGCALVAVALQVAGLKWAQRLAERPVP